jgi:cation diffusion facilitator CzcD-associated flavoprotein CzcO
LADAAVDIAIIGAGPYALALAAHLRRSKRSFRIWGESMRSWSHHMPRGMCLKSEGFASDLYDPDSKFTLKEYCAEHGIPYADIGVPVRIETFVSYGLEFQRRYVPTLESVQVTSLTKRPEYFELTTATGEIARARSVIVAAGIMHFSYVPPLLASIPGGAVSHSSQHADLTRYQGQKVAVVGAGASAIDIAALLQQAGANAELIARTPTIQFHDAPNEPHSLYQKFKAPRSGLGTGWRSRMCTDFPLVFHALPQSLRHRAVQRHLGPAPCWFTREAVEGRVPMHLSANLAGAQVHDGRIRLALRQRGRQELQLEYDHVIAATGYKVDVSRLVFLDRELQSQIRQAEGTPILSRHFESSVSGLYFVGIAAANEFGPLLRFAYGARFTARRITKRLAGI